MDNMLAQALNNVVILLFIWQVRQLIDQLRQLSNVLVLNVLEDCDLSVRDSLE